MRLRSGDAFCGRQSLTLKATHRADHGIGDAGIAAGGIDQDLFRREQAGALAFANHIECGAVFDGTAGIEVFGFAVDFNARKGARHLLQPKQRSVADIANDVVRYGRRDRSGGHIAGGSPGVESGQSPSYNW